MSSSDKFLLFFHLIGFGVLISGVACANLGGFRIGKAATPAEALQAVSIAKVAGSLTVPGAVLLLITGLWLAHSRGQERELWVLVSVGLWITAVTLGQFQKQSGKRLAAQCVADIQAGGEPSEALKTLISNKAPMIRGNILNVIIVAFLVLMIWRPGA